MPLPVERSAGSVSTLVARFQTAANRDQASQAREQENLSRRQSFAASRRSSGLLSAASTGNGAGLVPGPGAGPGAGLRAVSSSGSAKQKAELGEVGEVGKRAPASVSDQQTRSGLEVLDDPLKGEEVDGSKKEVKAAPEEQKTDSTKAIHAVDEGKGDKEQIVPATGSEGQELDTASKSTHGRVQNGSQPSSHKPSSPAAAATAVATKSHFPKSSTDHSRIPKPAKSPTSTKTMTISRSSRPSTISTTNAKAPAGAKSPTTSTRSRVPSGTSPATSTRTRMISETSTGSGTSGSTAPKASPKTSMTSPKATTAPSRLSTQPTSGSLAKSTSAIKNLSTRATSTSPEARKTASTASAPRAVLKVGVTPSKSTFTSSNPNTPSDKPHTNPTSSSKPPPSSFRRTTKLTPSHTGPVRPSALSPTAAQVADGSQAVPSPLRPHLTGTPSKPTASSLAKSRSVSGSIKQDTIVSPPGKRQSVNLGRGASLRKPDSQSATTGHGKTGSISGLLTPSRTTGRPTGQNGSPVAHSTPSATRTIPTSTSSRLLQGTAASRARAAASPAAISGSSKSKSNDSPAKASTLVQSAESGHIDSTGVTQGEAPTSKGDLTTSIPNEPKTIQPEISRGENEESEGATGRNNAHDGEGVAGEPSDMPGRTQDAEEGNAESQRAAGLKTTTFFPLTPKTPTKETNGGADHREVNSSQKDGENAGTPPADTPTSTAEDQSVPRQAIIGRLGLAASREAPHPSEDENSAQHHINSSESVDTANEVGDSTNNDTTIHLLPTPPPIDDEAALLESPGIARSAEPPANPFGRIGHAGAHRPHEGLQGKKEAGEHGVGNDAPAEQPNSGRSGGGTGSLAGQGPSPTEVSVGSEAELVRDPAKTIVSPDAGRQA